MGDERFWLKDPIPDTTYSINPFGFLILPIILPSRSCQEVYRAILDLQLGRPVQLSHPVLC
jgi:hypothetical protein